MTHEEKVRVHYKGKRRLIRKYIKAMEGVLIIYKKESFACCPLCVVVSDGGCHDCPWYVLGGISGGCNSVKHLIRMGQKKARMKQLRRWITAYKKALEPRREV